MTQMQTVEIDLEVHKAIEIARTSFTETPNDVLRRLLNIGPKKKMDVQPAPDFQPQLRGRSWRGKGVELPHGTQLRMDYNGRIFAGQVHDGEWIVEGVAYKAPSAAANGVAITRDGSKTQLNGWIYWEALLPGTKKWVGIGTLRPDR